MQTETNFLSQRLLLVFFIFVCLQLLVIPTGNAADDSDLNKKGKKTSLADLENIARYQGYAGGRSQGKDDKRDSGKTWIDKNIVDIYGRGDSGMQNASIKGDALFNKQLKEKGLKLEKYIDDPNTDMQAMLLRNTATKELIIVFRGTEKTSAGDMKTNFVDGATSGEGVGYGQYMQNRRELAKWVKQAREEGRKVTVTGHSLGGALGQRFVNDFPGDVDEAVLFSSAGLGPGDVAKELEQDQRRRNKKMPKISYIDNPNDIVTRKTGERISGDTFHVTGGKTGMFDSHSEDFFDGKNENLRIQKVKDQETGWIPENKRTEPERIEDHLTAAERRKQPPEAAAKKVAAQQQNKQPDKAEEKGKEGETVETEITSQEKKTEEQETAKTVPAPLPPCSEVADGEDCDPGAVNISGLDPGGVCDQQCPEGYVLSCGQINGEWVNLGCIASGAEKPVEQPRDQPPGQEPKEDWEMEWEKNYAAYQKELDRLAEEKKKAREKDWADWRKHGYQAPKIDFGLQEWRQMSWGEAIVWNESLRRNLFNLYQLMKNKEHNIKIRVAQLYRALGISEDNAYEGLRTFYAEQRRQFETVLKGDPAITVWESYDARLSAIADAREYFSTMVGFSPEGGTDYLPSKLANPIVKFYWSDGGNSADDILEYVVAVQQNLRGDDRVGLRLIDEIIERVQDYNQHILDNSKNITIINNNLDAVLPRESYDLGDYAPILPSGGYQHVAEAAMRARNCEQLADQLDPIIKKLAEHKKRVLADDAKLRALLAPILARSEELMSWRDNWDDRSRPSIRKMSLRNLQAIALEVGHPTLGKRYSMKNGSLFNRLYDIQRRIRTPENDNGIMSRGYGAIGLFSDAMFNLRLLAVSTLRPILEQKTEEFARRNGKLPPITPDMHPAGGGSSGGGGRVKAVDSSGGGRQGGLIAMVGRAAPMENVLLAYDGFGRAVVNERLLAQRVEAAELFLESQPGVDELERVNEFEKILGECRKLPRLDMPGLLPYREKVAVLHNELLLLQRVYAILPRLAELLEEAEEENDGQRNGDTLAHIAGRMYDLANLAGLKDHPQIEPLLAKANEFAEAAKNSSAEAMAAIRELYDEFVRAYQQRDVNQLMRFLSEDWEADDGTTLDDMEEILENSFNVFDDVTMAVSGLSVQPSPNGHFEVSYNTDMRGVIYDSDLQHHEKATIKDIVVITDSGPRILKTVGTGFWMR